MHKLLTAECHHPQMPRAPATHPLSPGTATCYVPGCLQSWTYAAHITSSGSEQVISGRPPL